MFKLLRLEDRIVLDGAAMDAIHQKDQQDSHQYDMIMQAQGGHVSDHHLTPDAHQADIGAQDSGHDGTHTDLDTHQPLFLADVTDAGQHDTGLHVLVISSNIQDPDALAAAAKDDVLVIRYDANHTGVDDLAKMIHNALGGKKADSIAFATHDGNTDTAEIRLTSVDVTSQDTLLHDAKQQAFWKSVGSDLSDKGRIDLLACNVTADHAGEQFVTNLEGITGKHVAASSDITGNASFGGNWILETGNVDLKNVYFDDHKIDSYDGTLLNGLDHYYQGNSAAGAFNILDNQSYTKGTYAFFTFNPDTFQNTLGTTVSYTATGMPPGLSFNSTYRLFTGTPKPPLGKTLLPAYTITVFASDANGGTDSLSFTMKIANVATGESGQNVPKFASDPTALLYIQEGASAGTLLSPNYGNAYVPKAVDADPGTAGIIGYRIVAPTPTNEVWRSNFAIGTDGTLSAATSNLTPGLYKMTVEAYDGKGYQDTSHITVSVTSKPKPVAWLEFSNPSFEEMGGIDILTVNLANTVGSDTNVFLQFAGTATVGADYSIAPSVITVPAGSFTASMTLTGKADLLPEGNETIIASIYSGGVRLDASAHPTQVTATIVDNTPPQVSLALSANTFSEKGGSTVLTAALAGGATAPADLHVNLSFGGQATLNTDYTITNSVITIPKGQASAAITVAALKDIPFDNTGDETIIFTGTSTDAPLNPANSTLTATIKDFDFASQPTVTIDFARPYLYENETALLNVKLTNTAGITSPINVYYTFVSTGPLSATLGTDYNVTPSPQMITINPMAGGADVVIVGVIDGITETTDLHIVAMVDPIKTVDANVGSQSTADILIKDYTVPTVHLTLAAGTTVLEGSNISTVPINVTLDRPNPNNQVNVFLNQVNQGAVGYAAAPNGGDYTLFYDGAGTTPVEIVSGQYMVTFTPGVTAKTLYAKALADVYIEGTENLIFNVVNAGQFAYTSADTVTMPIIDANSSGAKVNLTLPNATFGEKTGTGNTTVLNLTMTEPIQGIVTAKLSYSAGTAVMGTDYTVSGATVVDGKLLVTIPASNNWAGITLIGKTDSYLEPAETVSFTLESATNAAIVAPAEMTATLIDNFNTPSVAMSFSSTFAEKTNNTSTLTIDLSSATSSISSGTTVNMYLVPDSPASYGYATPIADYSLGAPAVWNTAGYYTVPITSFSTNKIIVTGTNDTVVEPNETVGFGAFFYPPGTNTLGSLAYASTLLINDTTAGANLVSLGTIGSFNENGGTATMKVFITNAVASDTTVALAYSGIATSAATTGTNTPQKATTWDFTVAGDKNGLGTLVTIPAGQTAATLTFTAISDGAYPFYEGSETMSVAVSSVTNPAYALSPSPTMVTGTIIEQQAIPVVSMTYATGYSATFPENSSLGNGMISLTVPYPSQMNSTVNLLYATTGSDSAVLNTDYNASTQGTIIGGYTSADVALYGKDDPILEANKEFKVSVIGVVSGGGVTQGASPSSILATVMDDDATRGAQVYILPPGYAGVNSLGQFSEGRNATFTVGIDRSVSNVATVNLQFAGEAHYGTVGGQDYTVGYSTGQVGFQVATVNASTGKMQMTFQPGETRANVTVYALTDSYFETAGETVTVNVSSVAGDVYAGGSPIEAAKFMTTVPLYTATIMEGNTDAPKVSLVPIIATFPESGASQGQLAVRLEKAMLEDVTVNLNFAVTDSAIRDATHGADYLVDGGAATYGGTTTKQITVVIPKNQSQALVLFQGSPDTTYEGNEFVRLSIDTTSGDVLTGKLQVSAGNDKATMTEVESLAPPTVTLGIISGSNVTFAESATSTPDSRVTLGVYLSYPAASDTYVTLDMAGALTSGKRADFPSDYTIGQSSNLTTPPTAAISGSKTLVNVLVSAGSTATTLTLTAATDTATEGDEYLSPIVYTVGSGIGSPYNYDNTSSKVDKITLIDRDFTKPSVYISGWDGTNINEAWWLNQAIVTVDIDKSIPWAESDGFVGVVTLTMGDIAHYSAGTSGLLSGQDFKVTTIYPGSPPTITDVPIGTDGKINLTFKDSATTRVQVKFSGLQDSLYEPDGSEFVTIGIQTSGLTNLLTVADSATSSQTRTMMMIESGAKPSVSLVLSPSNATLYEAAGDLVAGVTMNKSGTVSLNLSTPTSESLTITVQLGSSTNGAYYDSQGYRDGAGFGTYDYRTTTSAGGTLSFTAAGAGATEYPTSGGPWTATFGIPAGVQSYNLFTMISQDDTVYEGPELVLVNATTVGGNFGGDVTNGGKNAGTVNGVTATIAESDTTNKPFIRMAFDTTPNPALVLADYTNQGYFSEGGAASAADGTNSMKLSLFMESASGGQLASASNTTVLLTFDANGTMKTYDNPPDGATPNYAWTESPNVQTWGASNGYSGGAYGYSSDYTATFSSATVGSLTVMGYSNGGTASAPNQATYTMLVVLQPMQTQYDIFFTGVKDKNLEGEEKITVQIIPDTDPAKKYAVSGAYASSAWVSTATLLDSDISLAPQVSLSFAQSTFAEGSNVQLVAYWDHTYGPLVQASTINLSFGGAAPVATWASDGSANSITNGGDYYLFGSKTKDMVIPKGATQGYIPLNAVLDGFYEGTEGITASITSVKGAIQAVTGVSVATATLIDADLPPTVTLAINYSSGAAITEANAHSATVTLYLSKSAANAVTAHLSFTNSGTAAQAGFATQGDYQWGTSSNIAAWSAGSAGFLGNWTDSPVVFSAGQTVSYLYFTAHNESLYEGNEKLVISAITSGSGVPASPGLTATQTVTIIDKDYLDVKLGTLGGVASFGENDGVPMPFTFGLYSAGTNTYASSPVVETITLTFTGGSSSYTAPQDYQVSTDSNGTIWTNVGATGTLTLTIPAGQFTSQAYLMGVNDNIFEGTESVRIAVVTASCNPTNAGTNAVAITATIEDDDPKTYVRLVLGHDINATEGAFAESGGTAVVGAVLVGADGSTGVASGIDITVNLAFTAGDYSLGQASPGVDYTYGAPVLIIPAGQTSAASPMSILGKDDAAYEGPETFTVGITGSMVGALPSTFAGFANKTLIIKDDDVGPKVGISIANASFAENSAAPYNFAAQSATLTVYLAANMTAAYNANTSPANEYVFLDIAGVASYGAKTQYTQGADFYLMDTAGYTIGAKTNPAGNIGYLVTIPKAQTGAKYYIMGVDDSQAPLSSYHQYEGDESLTISLGSQSSGTYYSNLQTITTANKVIATVIDDDISLARTVSFSTTGVTLLESNGAGTSGYQFDLNVATGAYPVTVNFQVIPSHTAAAPYGQAMVASDGTADAKPEDFDIQVYHDTAAGYYTSGLSMTGGVTFNATSNTFSLVVPSEGVKTAVKLNLGIFDDKMYEPTETFAINIVSVTGGVTGAFGGVNNPTFAGTITDNDTPLIKIEVDQSQPGMNDSRTPDWAAGHKITPAGIASPTYVVPKDGNWNGHYYMATTDGVTPAAGTYTTGAVEPAWGVSGNVSDNNIIWKDMGSLDQESGGATLYPAGTLFVNQTNGNYYMTTGAALKDMGRYNNYFVEGDAQSAGARYFKITKTVDTTDGVTVAWYVNTSPTAGHAAVSSGANADYSSGTFITGTAILPAQAGSVVVPYDMTVTADNVAEANANGWKDTDIVIGIKNAKYFTPPYGTFTEANLVAANNNPWAANVIPDGTAPPNFTVGNKGDGVYAEKYVGIYDDDFRPGDTGSTSANNPPVPLEPSKGIGSAVTTGIGTGDLTQGGYVAISTGMLYFQDIDQMSLGANVQNFDRLEYTVVTAPSNGTLFIDYDKNGIANGTDTILGANSTFYEGAIIGTGTGTGTYGQLTYLHNNGEQGALKDSFTYTVSDGVNVSYATTGNTLNYATSGNPWVFGITAQDKNSPPDYDNRVFWVDENVTGSVYKTSTTGAAGTVGYIAYDYDNTTTNNSFYPDQTAVYYSEGGYSGSYIVTNDANKDTAGNPLFKLVQTPADGSLVSSGSKLALQVASTAGLDFEARDAYVLQVKLYDSAMGVSSGGTASGGYHDVYIQVKVNEMPDQGYAPIGSIPDVTLLSTKTFVYKIPDTLFPGATSVKVESAYATPTEAFNGNAVIGVEPAGWLHFESTSNSLWSMNFGTDLANRPTTSQPFVITVKATYYFENGVTKNPSTQVQASFTLHYSMASLDLDAVMDALQYLDTDGEQFLPVEGDQVPVQDMMMARSGAPADAAQEVSEVLAMLDAEAYTFDEAQA